MRVVSTVNFSSLTGLMTGQAAVGTQGGEQRGKDAALGGFRRDGLSKTLL